MSEQGADGGDFGIEWPLEESGWSLESASPATVRAFFGRHDRAEARARGTDNTTRVSESELILGQKRSSGHHTAVV